MAYKDIDAVLAAQSDLVEPLAWFEPRLVKMAPCGEPPKDERNGCVRAAYRTRVCPLVPQLKE
jgi:hypothetical protein